MTNPPISILKTLWSRANDGRWGIVSLKGIELRPRKGFNCDFFAFDSEIELLTSNPSSNMTELMASFGPTDFLLKQSIVPVVSWRDGDNHIRCIGTASVISCTGYIITAAHVLMDPHDSGYGCMIQCGDHFKIRDDFNFGVFIPIGPGYGVKGFRYFPFEKFWVWGQWQKSPLFYENDKLNLLTDVAVCKIQEMPGGAAHQPLNLSIENFSPGECAYSIGYSEMDDIGIHYDAGEVKIKNFKMDLYVSTGDVTRILSQNHVDREVPTPGPCFEFQARIPGKMSGAPIFGAGGAVVRGVVSRSFSGERHAYGAMLGPAMHLPLNEPHISERTLWKMIEAEHEGIARICGAGL